jgi:dephospho-CoA kinase
MDKIQIIGLTGLNGSGKGSAAEHYSKEYGFKAYNTRDYITELLNKDGLPIDRPHMVKKANEMREKHGPQYFAEYFINKAKEEGVHTFTIDSIRNPEEARLIQNLQGKIVLIHTATEVRYERIKNRKSNTDNISYEEFLEQELIEMKSSDPGHQNMQKVFLLADYIADNNHYFGLFKSGLDEIFREEEVEEEETE